MAKVALLIGTEHYGQGFNPLPAAPKDVMALEAVLRDPTMGGFDTVQTLVNCQHGEIAETIETWFLRHTADELALLYLSGHGVKDAQRELYFAACNTRKEREELVTATAIPARFVHDWSRRSKAKRQVLILDCCFSGAFGDLLARDDGTADLESILGQEGRVVLTSSSSIQYSFEQRGGELSLYTSYLVEGIRTGAADLNDDGAISVEELHQYASRKVQEVSPAMNPKIIVLKDEGYQIQIASAPLGDPRVKYRKEVGVIAEEDKGEISFINRLYLEELWHQLELDPQEAEQIYFEVLEPFRQRKAKMKRYRQVLMQAIQECYPLKPNTQSALQRLQRIMGFRDEDVAEIKAQVMAEMQPQLPMPLDVSTSTDQEPAPDAAKPVEMEDDLSSEKGIDYGKLRDLLKAEKWKEADQETYEVILRAVGRKLGDYIREKELLNFPCTDLKTIDRLWVKYSQGRFGFSVQKKIYVECGAKLDGKYPGDKIWEKFGDRVGWCKEGSWLSYSDLDGSLSSPQGLFPGWLADSLGGGRRGGWLFSRAEACEL